MIKDIDAFDIQKYQQNRYPLLFVDRITEVEPGRYAKGFKNFTYNEWFFPAHFKDEPNVPGFVQLECLTQVFLMTFLTFPEYMGKKTAFLGADKLRFREKLVPGDRLDITAQLDSFRRGHAAGHVIGCKNGGDRMVLSVDLEIGIPDVMKRFFPRKR